MLTSSVSRVATSRTLGRLARAVLAGREAIPSGRPAPGMIAARRRSRRCEASSVIRSCPWTPSGHVVRDLKASSMESSGQEPTAGVRGDHDHVSHVPQVGLRPRLRAAPGPFEAERMYDPYVSARPRGRARNDGAAPEFPPPSRRSRKHVEPAGRVDLVYPFRHTAYDIVGADRWP